MSQQVNASKQARGLSTRWIQATVFGAMWGALEITVGTFMHALKIPFSGVWMASLGVAILVVGISLYRTRGLAWRAGVVCMLLKLISPGIVVVLPMASIMMEAVLVEATIWRGKVTPVNAAIAGALCTLSVIPQAAAYYYFIFGWTAFEVYIRIINQTIRFLGGDASWGVWAVILIVIITASIGVVAGLLGYHLGLRARRIREEAANA